ncbi:class I SAM-dependent methyltransferase [Sphingomicrobium sediminis]|uniref:Methyltransferase domain-containing protein n=1 Tax=Sphingomicrobium sediminis TaxID=2950949 RepID=A0A9X2EF62_9SPHN|nr:methyltransferase domain-containing protein [Sphingomicrobium sediminis]MCM8556417.1 methyltransferase domain-containing protein [Sphingomicrobium sediminis]
MRNVLLAATALGLASCSNYGTEDLARAAGAAVLEDLIADAVGSVTRSAAFVERDEYRNPVETLTYFGVQPTDTVVEIWPGGGYYTQILSPYLSTGGTYYAVASDRGLGRVRALQEENAALYSNINYAAFPASAGDTMVPNGSADVVLTFRNVHNWEMGDADNGALAFSQMYAMLKPGGTLGVVEHRLPESADSALEETSGYMKTSTVRALAEAAGFEFVGSSEINANPNDTADYPNGVWTLPPTLRLGDEDRDRYLAIGESDRMTLKFRKPA